MTASPRWSLDSPLAAASTGPGGEQGPVAAMSENNEPWTAGEQGADGAAAGGGFGGDTAVALAAVVDVEAERVKDRTAYEKFLKIHVRHITDGQGVVAGVLLVTPNTVMFDPNVSDPLVIEHGAEAYGVIAPIDFVVNAALFSDIAHMRHAGSKDEDCETDEPIYFPDNCPLHRKYGALDRRTAASADDTTDTGAPAAAPAPDADSSTAAAAAAATADQYDANNDPLQGLSA